LGLVVGTYGALEDGFGFAEGSGAVAGIERELGEVVALGLGEATLAAVGDGESSVVIVIKKTVTSNWRLLSPLKTRSHECERCTHKCVRHDLPSQQESGGLFIDLCGAVGLRLIAGDRSLRGG